MEINIQPNLPDDGYIYGLLPSAIRLAERGRLPHWCWAFPEAAAGFQRCLRSGTMTPGRDQAGPKKAAITAGERRVNLQEEEENVKEMKVC